MRAGYPDRGPREAARIALGVAYAVMGGVAAAFFLRIEGGGGGEQAAGPWAIEATVSGKLDATRMIATVSRHNCTLRRVGLIIL